MFHWAGISFEYTKCEDRVKWALNCPHSTNAFMSLFPVFMELLIIYTNKRLYRMTVFPIALLRYQQLSDGGTSISLSNQLAACLVPSKSSRDPSFQSLVIRLPWKLLRCVSHSFKDLLCYTSPFTRLLSRMPPNARGKCATYHFYSTSSRAHFWPTGVHDVVLMRFQVIIA